MSKLVRLADPFLLIVILALLPICLLLDWSVAHLAQERNNAW